MMEQSNLPTTEKILKAVAAAVNVDVSKLTASDPQKAAITTTIRFVVKMLINAGGSGSALQTSVKDSNKITAALKELGITTSVTMSASPVIVNVKTTTKEFAASNGLKAALLQSAAKQPPPPPPSSSPSPSPSSSPSPSPSSSPS